MRVTDKPFLPAARGLVEDLTAITLMSDGASVYECTSADEVIDLVQGGQGVFGIAVGRVWHEVEGTLAQFPTDNAACAPVVACRSVVSVPVPTHAPAKVRARPAWH